MSAPVTRREAAREATHRQILDAARQLLSTRGLDQVSLRSIGAEIGMTAPGLYRYFPSHDELLDALANEVFGELAEALEAARNSHDEVVHRAAAVCRAMRVWCISHPREFELLFAQPLPTPGAVRPQLAANHYLCIAIFVSMFQQIWEQAPFPITPDNELPEQLRTQLQSWLDHAGQGLPLGLAKLYLDCWVRLYGLISLEIFGHLQFAVSDVEPLFEATLADIADRIGVDLPPP